jgi:hypothetical protein
LKMSNLKQELDRWLKTFVEQPHPGLGKMPVCPFARQARIDGKIALIESRFGCLVTDVEQNLHLLDTKDVLVVIFDHTEIEHSMLASLVKAHNKILMPADYVILEDHPDAEEFVNGVKMNFGLCGLLVVQRLSKLNTASEQLRAKGYYSHWDQHALDEVVNWRVK